MPSSQKNSSPQPKPSSDKVVQLKTILPKRTPEQLQQLQQHQQLQQNLQQLQMHQKRPLQKSPQSIELFDIKKVKFFVLWPLGQFFTIWHLFISDIIFIEVTFKFNEVIFIEVFFIGHFNWRRFLWSHFYWQQGKLKSCTLRAIYVH